ncbi:hypothetical protein F5B20DRAFT_382670 [Whalleya microplaca]|nr:hypothetical protein F5B20DRAFT_382670 [Whalleya microplaca]
MPFISLPNDQQFWRRAPGPSPTTARRRPSPNSNNSHRQPPRNSRAAQPRLHSQANYATPRRRKPHAGLRPRWVGLDSEDGSRLAADPTVVLPSDSSHNAPRLEREEAFREPRKAQLPASDVVNDDAELYSLGLLYDSEQVLGPTFSLDAIEHSEPVYSVRPARRSRGNRRRETLANPVLSLDLSFVSLGADLERFLDPDGFGELESSISAHGTGSGARYAAGEPLTVIYELIESSTHSSDPVPADHEFPDLISDSEEDGFDDWAVLEEEETSGTDSDDDADIDVEAVDATSATGEAWIVLGDGS